jgi:hypothetical protein
LGSDDDQDQLPTGYFKIDLEKSGKDSVVGHILYGDSARRIQFAPSLDPNADEDGGYLIVFANTEQKNGQPAVSELRIYETKTLNDKPVAVVKSRSVYLLAFMERSSPKLPPMIERRKLT